MPIMITDAGKSLESGGRYIVYTIRTGVRYPVDLGEATSNSIDLGSRSSPPLF